MRALLFVAMSLSACSGGSGGGTTGGSTTPPVIGSINGATVAVSLTEAAIELRGSGFGAAPGFVRFTQGTRLLDVVPELDDWSDTVILVIIPEGDNQFAFTSPGAIDIAVSGPGGLSATATVNVNGRRPFEARQLRWEATTSLPAPLRAHAAVALEADPVTTQRAAIVYVIGGNDGAANTADVISNDIDDDGALDTTWTAQPALPGPRAFHAAALAEDTSAPVPVGAVFVYVVGGQPSAAAPGTGSTTVYLSSADPVSGTLLGWTETAPLPEPLLGARATVLYGYLHIVGGYRADGTASPTTYSARILPDGRLEPFTSAPAAALPTGVAFHDVFAFGGHLFLFMGATGPLADPFGAIASAPTGATWSVPARAGVVGVWESGADSDPRAKHVVMPAFKQPILSQGVAALEETELGFTNPDGNIVNWARVTGAAEIGLNVFNTAAVVSPVFTAGGTQRHLILGGDMLASPGTLTAAVMRSTAP